MVVYLFLELLADCSDGKLLLLQATPLGLLEGGHAGLQLRSPLSLLVLTGQKKKEDKKIRKGCQTCISRMAAASRSIRARRSAADVCYVSQEVK